jgi:hypothetical protein
MKIRWNKVQIAILSIASVMLLTIAVTDILFDFRVGSLVICLIVVVQALGLFENNLALWLESKGGNSPGANRCRF